MSALAPSPHDCDVMIAGGGVSGLTLGLALAQAGLNTIVADAQSPQTTLAPDFDGRAYAIAFASFRMWKALGLGPALTPVAQPIEEILVTDGRPAGGVRVGGPSLLHLHFDRREIAPGEDGEPLGYMLETRHIRLALDEATRAQQGLTVLAPLSVTALREEPGAIVTQLSDGRAIRSQVLIGADGRRSKVRELCGVRTLGWPYNVTAIVATVQHEKPHNGVAHEFFLPNGPFAILPLKGNRANIVWAEPHGAAKALLEAPPEAFLTELQRRFGDFLGALALEGPRFGYPLTLQLAEKMIAPRVALVGDSAHGIHPIAGQGLNVGLKDVAALADVLVEAAETGLDLGDPEVLARYQKARRFDVWAMAAATDFFDRLFSNDIAPVRAARRLGLAMVNRIGPARRFFMRYAGGGDGNLPRLMR